MGVVFRSLARDANLPITSVTMAWIAASRSLSVVVAGGMANVFMHLFRQQF